MSLKSAPFILNRTPKGLYSLRKNERKRKRKNESTEKKEKKKIDRQTEIEKEERELLYHNHLFSFFRRTFLSSSISITHLSASSDGFRFLSVASRKARRSSRLDTIPRRRL